MGSGMAQGDMHMHVVCRKPFAAGLKHVDMGRGTRLRRLPPGSTLGSPMYGMAAYNAAFPAVFGGCGFDGGITPPMGVSPTAALAEHQQVCTQLQSR
jgi:hypothetical protein